MSFDMCHVWLKLDFHLTYQVMVTTITYKISQYMPCFFVLGANFSAAITR